MFEIIWNWEIVQKRKKRWNRCACFIFYEKYLQVAALQSKKNSHCFVWFQSFGAVWLVARSQGDALREDNKPALEARDHCLIKTLTLIPFSKWLLHTAPTKRHTNPLRINAYHNTALKQVSVHPSKVDRASSTIKCHRHRALSRQDHRFLFLDRKEQYILGSWLLQRSECQ